MSHLYRKKPVVIEARQLTSDVRDGVIEWMNSPEYLDGEATPCATIIDGEVVIMGVEIETLEGVMRGDVGDWIIRGVENEFYPCKPSVFNATYELAEVDA